MSDYAVVDSSGTVVNIVEIDDLEAGREVFGETVELVPVDGRAAIIGGSWDGSDFAPPPPPVPTLDEARRKQSAAVSAACAAAITGGFESEALGNVHVYPSKQTDQTNLTGAVTASIMAAGVPGWSINFWCADADGIWAFVPHTAAQIQGVYADGVAALQAYQARNQALQEQIAAAKTVKAVQAIVWEPGA